VGVAELKNRTGPGYKKRRDKTEVESGLQVVSSRTRETLEEFALGAEVQKASVQTE
jgi:hypothetical protein